MVRPSTRSSAPGKVILFGEHAVVYGEPAIAVPVTEVAATAVVEPAPLGNGLMLVATDLDQSFTLARAPKEDPLAVAARLTLDYLCATVPDAKLTVRSTIPIASGLGSGAAVATAVVRALAAFTGASLEPSEVSSLVYEVERIHHGTPSGIDNTVVAHEEPIYFARSEASEPALLCVGAPFTLLIADSGLPSPTRQLVERVRAARDDQPRRYESLFRRIGNLVREGRRRIETGDIKALGPLMDRNHALLRQRDVSTPPRDRLGLAARGAGAGGAKLSGGG